MDQVYGETMFPEEGKIPMRKYALCSLVEHDSQADHLGSNSRIESS